MHLFHRITRRQALLAAVVPVALTAVAAPAGAQAADHPNGFTFVSVAGDGTLGINAVSSGGVNGPPPIANNIHVRVANGFIHVVDANDDVVIGAGCTRVSAQEAGCLASSVTRIEATLDAAFAPAASDVWRSDVAVPTTVSGGPGSDVFGRGLFTGSSRLEVRGGEGFDRMEYVLAPSGVTVSKDGVANDGRPGLDADNVHGDVEWLVGSLHGDSLNGDNADRTEFFEGMAGDDVLSGNGGSDVFRMGAVADGADRIFGGAGEDRAEYGSRTRPVTANLSDGGADDGEAGEGDELRQVEAARGGSAGDTLRGHPDGTAPMTLIGLGGADTITGARGGDTLNGGRGRDTISAGGGNDFIQARDGESDTVSCGSEFDTIDAEGGLDLFSGCEKFEQVGVLKLSQTRQAEAGAPQRIGVTWRHPESWRKLRSVQVRVLDDGIAVGSVAIAPHSRKLTAQGAVRLVRGDSSVSRKGATARARLALRLDPSVSGRRLHLEVEAVDTSGRRQIERAGALRVAG